MYLEYTGQIHAKNLCTPGGRIGMIGDAAYCGTAVSGAGTTLSLVGAYIMAGELAKARANGGKDGMRGYEKWMKPFARRRQRLLPGVPGIGLPKTEWGINVLYSVVRGGLAISKIGWIQKLAGYLSKEERAGEKLPDYREYEVGGGLDQDHASVTTGDKH